MAIRILTVVVFAVFITSVHGNTCESDACECSLSDVEILSDFIDARINAVVRAKLAILEERFNTRVDGRISTVNTTVSAVSAAVDERIRTLDGMVAAHNVTIAKLSNQPVIGLLYVGMWFYPARFGLRPVNAANEQISPDLSSMTVTDLSHPYLTSDNILAYRPYFANSSSSIVFINLEAAIPCYHADHIAPVCQLFTFEEDYFQRGKAWIQASDIGNNFRIFNNNQNKATYGFGVMGCPKIGTGCGDLHSELMLVCLLPPAECSSGLT